ncbi:MAG: DUF389 domain-containing protein [Methanomicrobiales archaeon]|nr:DUF389 domain-containing protein [Methanomicrobiales archaeon]
MASGRSTTEIIAGIAIVAAIIPPTVVSGLVLALHPMNLINSGLLAAGQNIRLIAGALFVVILQKIESRLQKRGGPHGNTGPGRPLHP